MNEPIEAGGCAPPVLAPTPAERPALVGGEDGLRDALRAYLKAQRRMLDKWGDGDANVRGDLWRDLHACEDAAEAALALPAAQDGDDEPICCSGQDCYCLGATKGQERAWAAEQKAKQLPTPNAIRGDNSLVTPCEFCGGRGFTDDGHVEWDGQIVSAPEGCVECDGRGTVAIRGDKGAEAVMVPREPTEAMVNAARRFSVPGYCIAAEQWPAVYRAMLAAAPTQAAAKDTP